jgi:hypothetical protein
MTRLVNRTGGRRNHAVSLVAASLVLALVAGPSVAAVAAVEPESVTPTAESVSVQEDATVEPEPDPAPAIEPGGEATADATDPSQGEEPVQPAQTPTQEPTPEPTSSIREDLEPAPQPEEIVSDSPDSAPTPASQSRAQDAVSSTQTVVEENAGQETTPTVEIAITTHPQSRTVEAGENVTFRSAATPTTGLEVMWERSQDDGATWTGLTRATGATYTIASVSTNHDGWLYRARYSDPQSDVTAVTNTAKLTVTPRANIRDYCSSSTGPSGHVGVPFCFTGPEKVAVGEDIVLTGTSGFLATDRTTGSVVNFFLDAEYSGDPNTIYSKVQVKHPVTGAVVTDDRSHGMVQADARGAWRVVIKWPTPDTVKLTQQEINQRFAVGSKHSVRLLSGSLLTAPADRQRGASVSFTIVNQLSDTVGLQKPTYQHHTYTSTVAEDSATAWIPSNLDVGVPLELTGTGWLTKDRQWGSDVTVRFVDHEGDYYRGGQGSDDTIWYQGQADEFGDLIASVPVPPTASPGDYLALEITTTDDGTAQADIARSWVSPAIVLGNQPYVAPLPDDATCTAGSNSHSIALAPHMDAPAANVGGTIRLTGKGWCNLIGGGSLIGVKINGGDISHNAANWAAHFDSNLGRETGPSPTAIAKSNKTIWYIIEADKHGNFDVNIPLPTANNSVPVFTPGAYSLQLLTRTISADPYYAGTRPDPVRTVKTAEFTVVPAGTSLENVKPGKPTAIPDPLHVTQDLRTSTRGGVSVQQGTKNWTVTVPSASPGDWAFVYLYDEDTPRLAWGGQWFEVNADNQILLPVKGAQLHAGTNKLSVQDRNGDLLGWATVTVREPAADPTEEEAVSGDDSETGSTDESTTSTSTETSGRPNITMDPRAAGKTSSGVYQAAREASLDDVAEGDSPQGKGAVAVSAASTQQAPTVIVQPGIIRGLVFDNTTLLLFSAALLLLCTTITATQRLRTQSAPPITPVPGK